MALTRRRARSGHALHESFNLAVESHVVEADERHADVVERLAELEREQRHLLTLKRKLEAVKTVA